MSKQQDPLFNPLCPEFIKNPYATYKILRESHPVYLTSYGFWVVTRYNDVKFVLTNKKFGKKFTREFARLFGPDVYNEPVIKLANSMMLLQDPPEHKCTRELTVHAFNKKAINNFAPIIQTIADELIDSVEKKKEFDIIKDFADPLPLLTICRMLGITGEDQHDFMQNFSLLCTLGKMFDPTSLTRQDLDLLNNNATELITYFSHFYEKNKHKAENNLVYSFAELEKSEKVSREIVIANIILLFLAGYETTAKFIGNSLLALYQNSDQLLLLKKEPNLFPNAVKELMRYDSSIQISGRIVLEDTEINGIIIPEGQTIIPIIGSANHDPDIFDNPDKLDITRNNVSTLSFGGGIHLCPGKQLSYLETEIALRCLLNRLPNLQLLDIDNPPWQEKSALRGLVHLRAVCTN